MLKFILFFSILFSPSIFALDDDSSSFRIKDENIEVKKSEVKIEKRENDLQVFVKDQDRKTFIESLNSLSRDTGYRPDQNDNTMIMLFQELDRQVVEIHQSCDLKVSYQMLSLSYAVRAKAKGSLNALRIYAEEIKKANDYDRLSAVSAECKRALSSMSYKILEQFNLNLKIIAENDKDKIKKEEKKEDKKIEKKILMKESVNTEESLDRLEDKFSQ